MLMLGRRKSLRGREVILMTRFWLFVGGKRIWIENCNSRVSGEGIGTSTKKSLLKMPV